MALLERMPVIHLPQSELQEWGRRWLVNRAFSKKQGIDFSAVFDKQVADALAKMLGGIEVVEPSANDLLPGKNDVVELGPVRVVGGIRPQNFDVGYRPDGTRFVSDSKTLNDTKSVGKNFQNMVNDLGTEATTVHIRFPYAVVGFIVAIPAECFTGATRSRFTGILDRLVGRRSPIDVPHKAEAVSLVLWDPATATINSEWPEAGSPLRIERFSEHVEAAYRERYYGMPPHNQPSKRQKEAAARIGEELPDLSGDDTDSEVPPDEA